MQSIKVSRLDLLATVKKNRDGHHKIFLEAQEGFRKFVIAELDKRLADVRKGHPIKNVIQFSEPHDHTRDYDRVIRMLEWTQEETITLSEHDFASYVQDDWNWKAQFLTSNYAYSDTAKTIVDTAGRHSSENS